MYRYGSAGGFWLGVGFFVLGLVITGGSFLLAASGGGGSYFVSYGLIIIGIVRMATGLPALLASRKQAQQKSSQFTGTGQPMYPGQPPAYPGQQMGYPPQQPMYPGQQPGYPPAGYPPQQPGYPPQPMGGYGSYAPPSQGGQPNPYGMPASNSQEMFGNSRPCWNCGRAVVGNPTVCPSCGAPQSTPTA